MSSVPPTAPIGGAVQATAPTVGTVIDPPGFMRNADAGTVMRGTVEGRDRQGNLMIRTDQGMVAVRTPNYLRPGTQVTMEMRVAGDQLQVVILSTGRGQGAAPALPPAGSAQQPATAPAVQPPVQGQAPATPAGPATSTPQPTPTSATPTPTAPTTPAPGAQAGAPTAPASGATAQPSAPVLPGTPAPAVTVSGSPALAMPAQPLLPLQAGQSVQAILLQALGAQPAGPQAQAGQPVPAQLAAQITAQPGGTTTATPVPGQAPVPAPTMAIGQPATPPQPGATPPVQSGAGGTPSPAAPIPTASAGAAQPAVQPLPNAPAATPPAGTPAATPAATPAVTSPVISPGAAPAAMAPAAPILSATQLTAISQVPAGQAGVPTPGAPAAPPASAAPPLPAGASATQILQALPTGSQIPLAITNIQPPPAAGQPQPLPPGLQSLPGGGATLTGTVVGAGASGQPLLQTSFGLVTVQGAQGLPVGSTVTMGLSPDALRGLEALAREAQGGVVSGKQALPGGLGRQWPALQEALAQLNPAMAQALVQSSIPKPGTQMAGALLFFMAALRGGDLRGFLGEPAMRALGGRDGRAPLLGRLSEDMGRMTRTAPDSAGTEWRAFYIPVFDGQDLQQLRLFLRGQNEDGEAGADGTGSGHRFLIDLDLSRIGALQLDGLARKERLDLIVRTHRRLPVEIRRDIDALFVETAERVGLQGQVSFQSTPHFPPLPFVDPDETVEIHSEIDA